MSEAMNIAVSGGVEDDGSTQLKELTIEILQKAKRHPILFKTLNREIARKVESHRDRRVISVLEELVSSSLVMDLGDREYFLVENIDHLKDRICAVMRSYHKRYPYEPGMGTSEIKKRFAESKTLNARRNIDPRLFELAMSTCKDDGLVLDGDYGVRLSEFTRLSSEDEEIAKLEEAILGYIDDRRFGRINIDQLSSHLGVETRMARAIISGMLKAEKLIRIEENRYFEPSAIEDVKRTLAGEFTSKARLRTAEITKALKQSRSKVIPLLEHFDEIGFTRRDGDYRELASPGGL